jgi:hypothetical protein
MSRRATWEQRLAGAYVLYIALAAAVLVVSGVILIVMAIASWAGDGNEGRRIDFSDFEGGLLGLGENDYRTFHATCAPGRVTVEFTPDDEVRITRPDDRLIASLRTEEASVACAGALREPGAGGYYVAGLKRTGQRPTRLECMTDQPIDLTVHPIFRWETDVYGGSIVLGTLVPNAYPRAFIISSFTEDGRADVSYRSPPCRVVQS